MPEPEPLKNVVEAALLAAGRPLSLDALQGLFSEIECPNKKELRGVLEQLAADYQGRGIEIAEVASGWRIQVGAACSPWVSRLWEERPARYSRALMETLALIAYRQPITRGEIEDIRGVSVSTNIVKTLLEREWVHVVGQRDVPGKPSLYATTRDFLDYFGLKSLADLPTLAELRDLDEINRELDLDNPDAPAARQAANDAGGDGVATTDDASAAGDATAAPLQASAQDSADPPAAVDDPQAPDAADDLADVTPAGAADSAAPGASAETRGDAAVDGPPSERPTDGAVVDADDDVAVAVETDVEVESGRP
ncbi:MAG: SMC-Scp complex subunit ScpB [Gammaproteobacteria bacterium]|nr:SMC-Scp complex subunit ScpB [Gammaproteobacteria bacterium]